MRTKYITQSGSEYIIDDVAKTWERKKGENASKIRSDVGTYEELDFYNDSGRCIRLICPPWNNEEWRGPRLITSTPIVSEEVLNA